MNEEEKLKEDVLFAVDMQLYNEFNDKLCEINEHLGDIYSYKDLDDVEKEEKEKEIKLLREAIKKQQKEIEFYKIQELGYLQGYEDGKTHKQTAVAIKNENAQYELIKRVIEEKDKEIEKLKSKKYILNAETNEIKEISISDDYISKDKIKEKIKELKNRKIGASTGIYAVQVDILEELLGETNE